MDEVQTLGKYELRGVLGKGAMGTVWDGWDPFIGRRVAIKTVILPDNPDPQTAEEIARFRREAQAAGALTHPNIVAVYDYGETKDQAYIVMEYVGGPSLKSLLDKDERFPLATVATLMEELLGGLHFSHSKGVVHRDIKPANVMLTTDRHVKIADFGIARIEQSSMTQAGTMMGTPAYMSPEQFMGQAVDARTDVYAAGILLYQLLTGDRPFEGSLTTIMQKVLNTEAMPPSKLNVSVPPALDAVVMRAIAKRTGERFASAADFARAVRAAIDGGAAEEPGLGSGLDDLLGGADDGATVIRRPGPASGIEATGTRRPAPAPTPAPATVPTSATAAPVKKSQVPLFAGIGVGVVAVLGIGGYVLLGGSGATPKPAETLVATAEQAPAAPVAAPATAPANPPAQAAPAQVAPAQVAPAQVAPAAPSAAQPPSVAAPAPATAHAQAAPAAAPAQVAVPASPAPVAAQAVPVQAVPAQAVPAQAAAPARVAASTPALSAATTAAPPAATRPQAAAPVAATPAAPPVATAAQTATPAAISAAPPPVAAQPVTVPVQASAAVAPAPVIGSAGSNAPASAAPPPIVTAMADTPVQAQPAAPAGPTPAQLSQQVAAALAQARCSVATATVPDSGPVQLAGVSGDPDSLIAMTGNAIANARDVQWLGEAVKPTLCKALDVIRPVAVPPGLGGPAVDLAGRGSAASALREDEFIQPHVAMTDAPGYLRLDYVANDGTIAHFFPFLPDTGAKGQKVAAQPQRQFAGRETVLMGKPGRDKSGADLPTWTVGEPFGTDMIIALASSAPFKLTATTNYEDDKTSGGYLTRLATEIARLQTAGAKVTGTLLTVHTQKK